MAHAATASTTPKVVTPYNFFFHPLHADHREDIQGVSILTNIALTAVTSGWYLLVFGAVHAREYIMLQQAGQAKAKPEKAFDSVFPPAGRIAKYSHGDFIGIHLLKKKQQDQLAKLEDFVAKPGGWRHVQKQTMHTMSSFNDWMLPTTSPSEKHGDKYRLTPYNIETLKADREWMRSYRKGVCMIARSWGWDLSKFEDHQTKKFKWHNTRGSLERVGTMLQSLTEFGEPVKKLRDHLLGFILAHNADEHLADRFKPFLKA